MSWAERWHLWPLGFPQLTLSNCLLPAGCPIRPCPPSLLGMPPPMTTWMVVQHLKHSASLSSGSSCCSRYVWHCGSSSSSRMRSTGNSPSGSSGDRFPFVFTKEGVLGWRHTQQPSNSNCCVVLCFAVCFPAGTRQSAGGWCRHRTQPAHVQLVKRNKFDRG